MCYYATFTVCVSVYLSVFVCMCVNSYKSLRRSVLSHSFHICQYLTPYVTSSLRSQI